MKRRLWGSVIAVGIISSLTLAGGAMATPPHTPVNVQQSHEGIDPQSGQQSNDQEASAIEVAPETTPQVEVTAVTPSKTIPHAGNPIIKDGSIYTADAAPLSYDGKLYIYAGQDEASMDYGSFNMNQYVVMATDDVNSGDWEIYEKNLVPGEVFSWATGRNAYAGQVAHNPEDGKFYWYVPIQSRDTSVANQMAIGVAVSDTPVGPWSDAIGEPLVAWGDVFGDATDGQEVIDPHVFIDEDGTPYLYWGSWYVARMVKLKANMVEKDGEIQQLQGLDDFYEAPWVFNRNGTYYMVYDWKRGGSECTPSNYQACIAYATASNPEGPWTYQGIILGGTSATTVHPSIVEFGGEWYITYHTKDAVNGGHFRRSVAIDKVEWDGDKILPVKATRADDPAWRLTSNVAIDATPSASYSETPPMRVGALNDGRVSGAMLPPDQWGNYRGTSADTATVPSDWIMYEWEDSVKIDGIGIEFHRDSNWIRPPKNWSLEYLGLDGLWHPIDIENPPTGTDQWHEVSFEAVQARALRMTIEGMQNEKGLYHSVSVSEWELYASDEVESIAVPETYTAVGEEPTMPSAARVAYGDGSSAWVHVRWEDIDEALYAQEGSFTVRGRVTGYSQDYVIGTVVVTDDGVAPPRTDNDTPVVTIALVGTGANGEWYSSAVVPKIFADDATDHSLSITAQVDGSEPVSAEGVRSLELAAVDGEGEHKVTAVAKDSAGNVSVEKQIVFSIDRTAPIVQASVDPEKRQVVIEATDALSGVDIFEYRLGESGWQKGELGQPIVATDPQVQRFVYRVIDVAGNITQDSVQIPRDPDVALEGNIAPLAKPTASYTAGWESVEGLNDAKLSLFEAVPGQEGLRWGTWPQLGEQWAQLEWDFEITTDAVGVWWYDDGGDTPPAGMVPPKEWKVQYLDGDKWVDVELKEGESYQRERSVFNTVEFAPISTIALRIVAQAWSDEGGSVGISEWHVKAAAAVEPPPTPEPTPTPPGADGDSDAQSAQSSNEQPTVDSSQSGESPLASTGAAVTALTVIAAVLLLFAVSLHFVLRNRKS